MQGPIHSHRDLEVLLSRPAGYSVIIAEDRMRRISALGYQVSADATFVAGEATSAGIVLPGGGQ